MNNVSHYFFKKNGFKKWGSNLVDYKMAGVEALLYAAGRPISFTEIVTQLKLKDELEAKDIVDKLVESYNREVTSLEIIKLPQQRVVLQLKSDFTKPASKYSIKPLLTVGPLRTLSYIAYHQPVKQTEIAEARGSHAYKHLKKLDELGLITREKTGRTRIVRTTPEFADYLGLSHNRGSMKRQLRRMFRKLELDQMEVKG
jgi:segregation and condensation protein B